MFTDLELMRIHVRTLFTHDERARILFVNEPDSRVVPAPRLFLGRTRQGSVCRFRADLTEDLVQNLTSLCAGEPALSIESDEPPLYLESYIQLLDKHAPIEYVSAGPAYHFPENIAASRHTVNITEKDAEWLEGGFEGMIAELPAWQPFIGLIEGGRAVSICRSVRITPEAHEAGVETLPAFRGRGLAEDVTAEWARQISNAGAIPLYSTSWENNASQSVAHKLRLKCYGTDFRIS
jgi:ribosomal protein S18 acetylase RimI-like enzyme